MKRWSVAVRHIVIAVLTSASLFAGQTLAQTYKDPHRPPCRNAACLKIRKFLESHYCGQSPSGNGPGDGCEIKQLGKPADGIEVISDYKCEWDEKNEKKCTQRKQPTDADRRILEGELKRLGLPGDAEGQIYFRVWKSAHSGWLVAAADYSRPAGPDVYVCEVLLVKEGSQVTVLRSIPFQKTDADVPTVTFWAPIDIVDVKGDGQEALVLEADAYENHWLEVVNMGPGASKTVFSGLGYYL